MTPAPDTGRTAEDEMEAEIGFAFARYLSASDLDVSLRRRVKAAVEPILEDLIAARKERDEARGYANRNGNAARYWEWIHGEKDKRLARALEEAAQLRSRLLEAEKGAEAMKPHDYEVIGTTYDGVKVLRAVSEPTHFTREEIRAAVKAALSSEPRCTATGNPCGTDTVMAGQQCPDNRWGGRCAHRIAEAAKLALLTQEEGR